MVSLRNHLKTLNYNGAGLAIKESGCFNMTALEIVGAITISVFVIIGVGTVVSKCIKL